MTTALTAEFCNDATKQKQWNAFVSKNKLYIEPITLQEVTASIRAFVVPVLPSSAADNLPMLQGGRAVLGNTSDVGSNRGSKNPHTISPHDP